MKLPPPEYKKRLNHSLAGNGDIITTIQENFPKAVEQTKEFAQQFKSDSAIRTAHKVWSFLRSHIHYLKDTHDAQLIRLPSRFVADGAGDCKSYALFSASVLQNLGMPIAFRYANYTGGKVPTHVYVVTKDESGKEIIVDGVYRFFNREKSPTYKFDNWMNVYTLSGIEGIYGKKRKGRFAHKLAKIGLAVNRRAFRTLVAVNLFGLAKKLKRVLDRDPKGLEKKWYQLGGEMSSLRQSIKAGYNHWAKHHHQKPMTGVSEYEHQEKVCGIDGGIGLAPAVGAIVTAAATIVAALAPLFKKHGDPEPGSIDASSAASSGEPMVDKVIDSVRDTVDVARGRDPESSAAYEDPTSPENASKYDVERGQSDAPKTGFKLSPKILLIGGAALAAFILLKKKR